MPRSKLAVTTAMALLLGVVAAQTAHAQTRTGDLRKQKSLFEIGLYFGAHFPPEHHALIDGSNHLPLKPAFFDIGLRLSYLPIPWVGAELETGLIPGRTKSGESAMMWTFRGHAILQLPLWKRWAPFLVAGVGALGMMSQNAVVGPRVSA